VKQGVQVLPKWNIYTPEGVQDILINECFIKRNIENDIREVFRKSGYFEIETPTFEFYDTFSVDQESIPQEMMFKFFDRQGRILVLRPDLTIPVARVAAGKFKDFKFPMRFCYIGNTFRYNESGGGKHNEFTQAGVELLGAKSPEADAEVIAVAIKAIKASGLENFQIDIGQVDFFNGLMEESGLDEQDVEELQKLIDRKDFIGMEEIINQRNIPVRLKQAILDLTRLFGSEEVIDRAEKLVENQRSLNALKHLRNIIDILKDFGLGKYVSVDLGMVRSINYYTGVIFRGFTYGVGFPILSGGRYDRLTGKFGKECPATGFSIGINLLMSALVRQNADIEKPSVDSLVCYEKEGRKRAFEICEALRKQGLVVEMDISMRGLDYIEAYSKAKGIGGIIRVLDDERVEVRNFETGEVHMTTVSRLKGGCNG